MWEILLVAVHSYTVEGDAHYAKTHGVIADFGYYSNGTLTFTVQTKYESLVSKRIRMYLFDNDEYNEWVQSTWDEPWERCPENISRSAGNWTTELTRDPQTEHFSVPEERVYAAIVIHCDDLKKGGDPVYHVVAQFLNPNGQHLDSRVIPYFTVIYCNIGVFLFVDLVFIVLLCVRFILYRGRPFLPIHILICWFPIFSVCVSVLKLFSLRQASVSDDTNIMEYVYVVFSCINDISLFSLMVIAASGWCLLNTELRWYKVCLWIFATAVCMSGYYIRMRIAMSLLWHVILIIVQMLSLMFVLWAVLSNIRSAKQRVKAHLLVIRNAGIDPHSTPIYKKWKFFSRFLYIVSANALAFVAITMMFAFLNAPVWISMLAKDVLQLVLVLTFMALYRPRYGRGDDAYLWRDNGTEAEREAVTLNDLDRYDPDESGAMRIWEDGDRLPLEPVLVSSTANLPLTYDPYRVMINHTQPESQ